MGVQASRKDAGRLSFARLAVMTFAPNANPTLPASRGVHHQLALPSLAEGSSCRARTPLNANAAPPAAVLTAAAPPRCRAHSNSATRCRAPRSSTARHHTSAQARHSKHTTLRVAHNGCRSAAMHSGRAVGCCCSCAANCLPLSQGKQLL